MIQYRDDLGSLEFQWICHDWVPMPALLVNNLDHCGFEGKLILSTSIHIYLCGLVLTFYYCAQFAASGICG